MDRLEEIKKKDTKYQLGGTTLEADWKYLIQQAELYQECAADATKLYKENQCYEQALEEIKGIAEEAEESEELSAIWDITDQSLEESK